MPSFPKQKWHNTNMRYLQLLVFSSLLVGALHASLDDDPLLSPHQVATEFLRIVKDDLEFLNYDSVASRFQNDFYFTACSRNLSRSQVLEKLASLKDGTQIDLKLLEASLIDNRGFYCRLGITGIERYFEAEFYVNRVDGIHRFANGVVTNCNEIGNGFFIIREFTTKLDQVFNNGTLDDLATLFEDEFVLTGCNRKFTKKQIYAHLKGWPKSEWVAWYHFSYFSFIARNILDTLLHVEYEDIYYTIAFKIRIGSWRALSAETLNCD
uniref:NTF2-like domain-containing protein n=1 Tax=Caenorhabditis japonica TaxID=281687 RepID=A0A8R1EDP9_CAEJA